MFYRFGSFIQLLILGHLLPIAAPETAGKECRCTAPWTAFNSSCYQVVVATKTFYEAEQNCQEKHAHLVKVDSSLENNFIFDLSDVRNNDTRYWIGLRRRTENSWHWMNGEPLSYSNWEIGEPNNDRGTENCVEMRTDTGKWNDVDCSVKYIYRFVCEKALEPCHNNSGNSGKASSDYTENTTSESARTKNSVSRSSSWTTEPRSSLQRQPSTAMKGQNDSEDSERSGGGSHRNSSSGYHRNTTSENSNRIHSVLIYVFVVIIVVLSAALCVLIAALCFAYRDQMSSLCFCRRKRARSYPALSNSHDAEPLNIHHEKVEHNYSFL